MMLLTRYIAKAMVSSIALITLLLTGLQLFILFVNQLDDLGKSHYGLWQALWFVLLQTPYQVYLFFPVISLLGCLVALGIMAHHRELVVMRAAGMSIGYITWIVLKVALIIIIIMTIAGETLLPKLAIYSNNHKIQAMSEGNALRTDKGVWLRYRNDFITIKQVLPGYVLKNVYQFHFDEQHRLRFSRKIDTIRFQQNKWWAYGVAESIIHPQHIEAHYDKKMPWDISLQPRLLQVGSHEPDEMTLKELHHYIKVQTLNHQSAHVFKLAFWQRLLQPIATAVMMVLAIPFIFGPLRSSTMGAKLLAGTTVGFGFYIINRIVGPMTQVWQWPVEIAAFGPMVLFALLGFYLMRRMQ